jgi:hypothetical protein
MHGHRRPKKTAFRRLISYLKKPPFGGVLFLLDLGFFVDHVLSRHGIVLPGLHLFGMKALVLLRRIEMPGIGAGNESDFVTHDRLLRKD